MSGVWATRPGLVILIEYNETYEYSFISKLQIKSLLNILLVKLKVCSYNTTVIQISVTLDNQNKLKSIWYRYYFSHSPKSYTTTFNNKIEI